jgi:flavin-dependent dehydrogenase
MYDAIVIGAGPAGSVAARELARRGLRVSLVDRASFPRPKVCGCCLNRAALAALEEVGLGDVPARCGAVPLRGVTIAAGGRSASVPLPGGVSLSRESFDAGLIGAAVKAGVTFSPNTPTKLADALAAARVVVVATGLGPTATPTPASRIGAGVVAPDAPDFYRRGTIHMATGRGGYVGLVRLEDDRLDIAAAFDASFVKMAGGPGGAAEFLLQEVGWPGGFADLPWKGTPALTRTPAAVAGERWFAVGDAAGYVEPFTGEGMAWAIASAAALAPIAVRAMTWDSCYIAEWGRTHARVVGRRQRTCRVVARVLRYPAVTRAAVRALGLLPALSRPVVALLNRPHGSLA